MRVDIQGVGFDNVSKDEAVEAALKLLSADKSSYIVTPNPEIVWSARNNPFLKKALIEADLVLADGVGITLAAKLYKTPLKERVPGIDFAVALLQRLVKSGSSIFLFGAKPGVAELAAQNLTEKHEGLVVLGTNDGFVDDSASLIDKINKLSPDVLLVCLGSPKQELWIAENISKLNVKLCIALGGSLDVFAGIVKRAPEIFRKTGFEWLYRLIKQPQRIKRMIRLPLFLMHALLKR